MSESTCILKVGIYCDGCKKTVGKVLRKIEGVEEVEIDADEGKVTVIGNVDPETLLKILRKKAGKRAQLWSDD